MGAGIAWVAGVSATSAWSAWLALGCTREELEWAKGSASAMLARLARALAACRSRLPAPAEERVGLEDVSEMVDVVGLGLTAGLSFDAALGLYCEYRAGRLSRRLARARLSWQIGAETREEALDGAARDLGSSALASFSRAVAQALAMGAPLAGTLERQAAELRSAHRASVEREIERAPVKILIPTGTLILPALLIAIMGPLLAAAKMI